MTRFLCLNNSVSKFAARRKNTIKTSFRYSSSLRSADQSFVSRLVCDLWLVFVSLLPTLHPVSCLLQIETDTKCGFSLSRHFSFTIIVEAVFCLWQLLWSFGRQRCAMKMNHIDNWRSASSPTQNKLKRKFIKIRTFCERKLRHKVLFMLREE